MKHSSTVLLRKSGKTLGDFCTGSMRQPIKTEQRLTWVMSNFVACARYLSNIMDLPPTAKCSIIKLLGPFLGRPYFTVMQLVPSGEG